MIHSDTRSAKSACGSASTGRERVGRDRGTAVCHAPRRPRELNRVSGLTSPDSCLETRVTEQRELTSLPAYAILSRDHPSHHSLHDHAPAGQESPMSQNKTHENQSPEPASSERACRNAATFAGNTYDLSSLGALACAGVLLFLCVTCNMVSVISFSPPALQV